MLVTLFLAAAPITVVAPLDDKVELLRFRAAICQAWQEKQAMTLWGDRSASDGSVSWEVELSPDASGRMLAKVTERRSSPPPTGITIAEGSAGNRGAPGQPLEYDTLELVAPNGKAAPGTGDCQPVIEGRLIPQLKAGATGHTLKW